MTYAEAKQRRASAVYGSDGYGGISCYRLDWDQGVVRERARRVALIKEFFSDDGGEAMSGSLSSACRAMEGGDGE